MASAGRRAVRWRHVLGLPRVTTEPPQAGDGPQPARGTQMWFRKGRPASCIRQVACPQSRTTCANPRPISGIMRVIVVKVVMMLGHCSRHRAAKILSTSGELPRLFALALRPVPVGAGAVADTPPPIPTQLSILPGLRRSDSRDLPPRGASGDVASARLPCQVHTQDNRGAGVGCGADLDVASAARQAVRVDEDPRPGHQGQVSPDSQVDIDVQGVVGNESVGEVELRFAEHQQDLHAARNQPAAFACDMAETLVDPDKVPGLRRHSLQGEVAGQPLQLPDGTGRQRSVQALIQLGQGESTVARGNLQDLHDLISVPIRRPQLGPCVAPGSSTLWPRFSRHVCSLVGSPDPPQDECDRQLYMANDDRRDLGIRLNHQLQMAESPSSTWRLGTESVI